ncbi:MAG: hypothetical protein AAF821_25440, partial [Cyanobacteria bacterium P01_D01_bin.156]
ERPQYSVLQRRYFIVHISLNHSSYGKATQSFRGRLRPSVDKSHDRVVGRQSALPMGKPQYAYLSVPKYFRKGTRRSPKQPVLHQTNTPKTPNQKPKPRYY